MQILPKKKCTYRFCYFGNVINLFNPLQFFSNYIGETGNNVIMRLMGLIVMVIAV